MRLDVPSIVAVLRSVSYVGDPPDVMFEGECILLNDYLDRLEAAHASPRQSVLLTSTPDQTAVIKHIAEP